MFVDYAPKLEAEHVIWNSFDRRLWRIPQRGRATECPLLLSQPDDERADPIAFARSSVYIRGGFENQTPLCELQEVEATERRF
jgi:hypothetical protein